MKLARVPSGRCRLPAGSAYRGEEFCELHSDFFPYCPSRRNKNDSSRFSA